MHSLFSILHLIALYCIDKILFFLKLYLYINESKLFELNTNLGSNRTYYCKNCLIVHMIEHCIYNKIKLIIKFIQVTKLVCILI